MINREELKNKFIEKVILRKWYRISDVALIGFLKREPLLIGEFEAKTIYDALENNGNVGITDLLSDEQVKNYREDFMLREITVNKKKLRMVNLNNYREVVEGGVKICVPLIYKNYEQYGESFVERFRKYEAMTRSATFGNCLYDRKLSIIINMYTDYIVENKDKFPELYLDIIL